MMHALAVCSFLFLKSVPLFVNTTIYWDFDRNMLNPYIKLGRMPP